MSNVVTKLNFWVSSNDLWFIPGISKDARRTETDNKFKVVKRYVNCTMWWIWSLKSIRNLYHHKNIR